MGHSSSLGDELKERFVHLCKLGNVQQRAEFALRLPTPDGLGPLITWGHDLLNRQPRFPPNNRQNYTSNSHLKSLSVNLFHLKRTAETSLFVDERTLFLPAALRIGNREFRWSGNGHPGMVPRFRQEIEL